MWTYIGVYVRECVFSGPWLAGGDQKSRINNFIKTKTENQTVLYPFSIHRLVHKDYQYATFINLFLRYVRDIRYLT